MFGLIKKFSYLCIVKLKYINDMATTREKIEHFEHQWVKDSDTPWQNWSYSRKWLKKQMNRYIRRQNKKIEEDDITFKQGRKPLKGWEY